MQQVLIFLRSKFDKKADSVNLKSDVDKLGTNKLKHIATDIAILKVK